MSLLPPEILHEILAYSLDVQSPPVTALLTTCSGFRDVCQRIIYTALHFTSLAQLRSFVNIHKYSGTRSSQFKYPSPRSVELDIPNNESNLVFTDIHALFSQCFQLSGTYRNQKDNDGYDEKANDHVERDKDGRLILELLRLRMNSHVFDPHVEMIYNSLSLVNPRRFIWTGPDPPHHFSIAIVPNALPHLFHALSEFTNLIYLKLTHFNMTLVNTSKRCRLPIIPSLRTLYLGQVIFLHPSAVSEFVLHPAMSANLESVNLVDAYRGSIWGFRLRRSDVELVVTSPSLGLSLYPLELPLEDEDQIQTQTQTPLNSTVNDHDHQDSTDVKLATIRRIIVCEARTERLMGGDRVENVVLF